MFDVLDYPVTMTHGVDPIVETSTAGPSFDEGSTWATLTGESFDRWERDPSMFHEEGLVPPSAVAIARSRHLAEAMKRRGGLAPTRIVPTTGGGVSFEWDLGPSFHSLTIAPDGSELEVKAFEFGNVISRKRIAIVR